MDFACWKLQGEFFPFLKKQPGAALKTTHPGVFAPVLSPCPRLGEGTCRAPGSELDKFPAASWDQGRGLTPSEPATLLGPQASGCCLLYNLLRSQESLLGIYFIESSRLSLEVCFLFFYITDA